MDTHLKPILIVAAVKTEVAPTARRLGLRWRGHRAVGTWRNRRIVAVVTGIGPQRAIEAVNEQLHTAGDDQPEAIISIGLAGALDPALAPAAVVQFGEVLNESGQQTLLNAPQGSPTLLTASTLVDSPERKNELYQRFHASAVDMETWHLAQLAQQRDLPFVAVRAISDSADTALPAASLNWVRPNGSPSAIAAGLWTLRHPTYLPQMFRLGRHSQLGATRLAAYVQTVIERDFAPSSDTLRP